MFHTRPPRYTLTRGREDRRAHAALHTPEGSGTERFDPDFRAAARCSRCGKLCYGPKRFLREAIKEHWATTCPARHTKADTPLEALILYPNQ